MKFTDLLEEFLDLRAKGPDERDGYTDKAYYARLEFLRRELNHLVSRNVNGTSSPR